MKNKHTRNLSSLLSTCNLGPQVSVESRDDGVFLHVEPDVTIISYLFQAADDGRQVVRIITDDSDISVLLVFWTWRYGSQDKLVVQMEKWNGVVLDINATCASLGQALCSQLLGAHALSGCDTVLFPFGKGQISKRRQLPRVAWCPWWGGCHAGGSHGNSSSKRYTDIPQHIFKSANGIVFVEKNGSRINIKHKVNTIWCSLMDRILWPLQPHTFCTLCITPGRRMRFWNIS